jgi:hypothetical protein
MADARTKNSFFNVSRDLFIFFKKSSRDLTASLLTLRRFRKKKVQEKIKGVLAMRLEIKPTMKKNLIKRSIEPCHYLATNLRPHFHQKKKKS